MGGEHHPVSSVGHGRGGKAGQVGAPMQPPEQTDVIGSRRAHGIQQGLHAGSGKGCPAQRTALEPGVIAGGIGRSWVVVSLVVGFVVKVENHSRVVGVSRRHRAPESHPVGVSHSLLFGVRGISPAAAAGRRGRRRFARPVQVQDDVNALPRTVIHHAGNIALVIRLIGTAAAKPKILVQGQADDGAVPRGHRFRGHGGRVSPVPAWRTLAGIREFQPIAVHPSQLRA